MMIFYWDDVFNGYRSGMCVIVADSLEKALELAKEKLHRDMYHELRNAPVQYLAAPFLTYRHGCD